MGGAKTSKLDCKMGQNQGKEGEPVQDNSSVGPEEKGPSPDSGGAAEEGNPTIESGGDHDEEKGSLDEGSGRASPSPLPEQAVDPHDEVCAPTDGEVEKGGDGEREGGRKSREEGRAEPAQQMNGVTQSQTFTQSTWESAEVDHEREDSLESSLEDQRELVCESIHRGADQKSEGASYVKDEMESVCGEEGKLEALDGEENLSEAPCPTLEIPEGKKISKAWREDDKFSSGENDLALHQMDTEPEIKRQVVDPVIEAQTETSGNTLVETQQARGNLQESLITDNKSVEFSSETSVEMQVRSVKEVYDARENLSRPQPADDVIKSSFTSSSVELQSETLILKPAESPENLKRSEVAFVSSQGHAESHQQIFTQDELDENQMSVSDSESTCIKEPSLEGSHNEGHKNIGANLDRNLESLSKDLCHPNAKTTEMNDLLCGAETEECCLVKSGESTTLPSFEDEKTVEEITETIPSSTDVQAKSEKDDSVPEKDSFLSTKDKDQPEQSLELFNKHHSQIEAHSLPGLVKDMDPEHSFSVRSGATDVEYGTEQQGLEKNGNANSVGMMSSETDKLIPTTETSAVDVIAASETIDDRPSADRNTELTLPGSPQLQEQCFVKISTHTSTSSNISPPDVSDQIPDSTVAEPAEIPANDAPAQDLVQSLSACSSITLEACEKQDQEHKPLMIQAHFQGSEENGSSQLDQKQAVGTEQTTITETSQSEQKRHVSDMIKEAIELQKKMKEWSKPAETRVDLTLDPTQSVKVSQMKAAFDPPKKLSDKPLERKPSVRKGKTLCGSIK
ncbi:hypothetical protein DNTS_002253, partial [Danionella cerebrum]